ncbi:hypothetical protein SAMN04489708_105107 [Paracidovorax cattleyae]|uniref:Lipoprotein n=2 Tax=Paracidovorax cattleyae TaxID=80868 RepID=A0A1H0NRA2_9BURK|nr:hypothetical protein SAMN04489708_105107 [Paracidovorax cattleyae]
MACESPPALRRAVRPALLCCIALAWGVAHAAPYPTKSLAARVAILDARSPATARLATMDATDPSVLPGDGAPLPQLRFLRLSPATASSKECCVQPLAPVDPRDASTLRYEGEDAQPAAEREVRFTHAPREGFVGLAVEGDAVVTRMPSHRILLRWPDRKASLRVDHCLSAEGLHLKISEGTGAGPWKPAAHYYLPLAADARPDCPQGW